jgi:RHS repeat-associated protein
MVDKAETALWERRARVIYRPLRSGGQYADASTGLVNDRARFYEPQTGGFTTRDPDFALTDTAYTYAADDPVNGSDPSGLISGWGRFMSHVPMAGTWAVGWDSMSGKEQLADITLPITLPLTGLAVVSGVGALGGVGVLGATEGATGVLAVGSGATATGADLAECLGLNDKVACIGAGIGSVGLGGVGLGFALGGETIGGGLAGAFGFAIAGTGSVWDLLSQFLAFEGVSISASSSCAPRK